MRHDGRVETAPDDIRIVLVDPGSPDARTAMSAYFAELDERFPGGFDAGSAAALEPDAFAAPSGAFVVALTTDGDVVGAGALRRLDDGVGEIKRMWVDPRVRGRGLSSRLLARLEDESRSRGHRVVRLDTNATLVEAIRLYRRHGYVEIERYNDNPDAQHWFEKLLV